MVKSSFSFFRRHEINRIEGTEEGEDVEDELNSDGENGDENDEDDVHDIDHTKLPLNRIDKYDLTCYGRGTS